MKYILIIFAILFLCHDLSFSNELDSFLECKNIENNDDRLKCYDSVKVNKNQEYSGINGWRVEESRSKLDDTINISYIKKSSNKLPSVIGNMENGSFVVRCSKNTTEVYVIWPSYIGLNGKNVQYKMSKGDINKEEWSTSTDGKAVFVSKPIDFLKRLQYYKTVIIQLSPHARTYEELEFDIEGINKVVENISECCNWKKDDVTTSHDYSPSIP